MRKRGDDARFKTCYEDEEKELITPIAARSEKIASARGTVETEETLSPPMFVPLAEVGEFQVSRHCMQKNTDIQSKSLENFKRRYSIRRRMAKAPDYYCPTKILVTKSLFHFFIEKKNTPWIRHERIEGGESDRRRSFWIK